MIIFFRFWSKFMNHSIWSLSEKNIRPCFFKTQNGMSSSKIDLLNNSDITRRSSLSYFSKKQKSLSQKRLSPIGSLEPILGGGAPVIFLLNRIISTIWGKINFLGIFGVKTDWMETPLFDRMHKTIYIDAR